MVPILSSIIYFSIFLLQKQVVREDSVAIQSAKKMRPFLMLCDDDSNKRKELLSKWMANDLLKVDGM